MMYRGNFRPSIVSEEPLYLQEDDSDDEPLSSLTCEDGHEQRVPLHSGSIEGLREAITTGKIDYSTFVHQKKLLQSTCEHCGNALLNHHFKDSVTLHAEEEVTAEHRRSVLLQSVPQLAAMPESLQAKVLRSFQPIEMAQGTNVVRLDGSMATCYYVQSGKFASYRREVGCGTTLLREYTAGSIMAMRVLQQVVTHSSLQIDCISPGLLYGISGKTFRKLQDGMLSQYSGSTLTEFLRALACLRKADTEQIQQVAELATEHTLAVSEEATQLFVGASQATNRLFMIRSGTL